MEKLKELMALQIKFESKDSWEKSELLNFRREYMKSEDKKILDMPTCYFAGTEEQPVLLRNGEIENKSDRICNGYLVRLCAGLGLYLTREKTVKLLSMYAMEWWNHEKFYSMLGISMEQLLNYCARRFRIRLAGIQNMENVHLIMTRRIVSTGLTFEELLELKGETSKDNMTKYECVDCHGQFITGDRTERKAGHVSGCPYCGSQNVSWITKAQAGSIAEMGDLAIWS